MQDQVASRSLSRNHIRMKHKDFVLPLDAFVRSVGVSQKTPWSLFLGAGASISSGVPSAEMCIWQWKQSIFLTRNPGLEKQFFDVSIVSVQDKLQRWLDEEGGHPPNRSSEEYGHYVQEAFPIAEDRRQFFRGLVSGATPHIGYQLLPLLAEAGIVRHVWTTNFDGLVCKAAAISGIDCIEIGLDTSQRVLRPPHRNELLAVALHGDYRYDDLKNTPAELQEQDKQLRSALVEHLGSTSLIVIGYSGRDMSVMDTLMEAYSRQGSGRLIWCLYGDSEPSEVIQDLLLRARRHGRKAYWVASNGFDDLMERIALHCLEAPLVDRARELISKEPTGSSIKPLPFNIDAVDSRPVGLIKSNAFEVECPTELFQFEVRGLVGRGAWKDLRAQVGSREIAAGLLKGKVLAISTLTEIKDVFSASLVGDITRVPISGWDLSIDQGVIVSILTDALVRAIADARGLESDNRRLVWERHHISETEVHGVRCRIHNAALVYMRRYGRKQYFLLMPTIRGIDENGLRLPLETEKELRRRILTTQYNKKFNDAIEHWRSILFPEKITVFEFPPESGSGFKFSVKSIPAFARISAPRPQRPIQIPRSVERHISYTGTQYEEPKLAFCNKQGDGYAQDTHQLRGILRYQPYDYPLTLKGIAPDVAVGVVCPGGYGNRLAEYLANLHQRVEVDSKKEYLLEYPGFSQAFGVPLELPRPGGHGWVECPLPHPNSESRVGAAQLRRSIVQSIDALIASSSVNLVLIFVPNSWRSWEHYEIEGERFDLHDYVKAYCVQKGVPTQFLRESTLDKTYICEVVWWLALSFYTKAMRTPWVLDAMDEDTAFMGLGFSIQPRSEKGHIVVGCSHIYNSEGLGLRYRLSKLEDPIVRRGNPFMSRDDARRIGANARQLFYEAQHRLPSRVVVHKTTPFLRAEREGLLDGLSGIDAIDMLEINFEPALRYVASRVSRDGRFEGDGFPVRRGTTVVLDDQKALIWAHGTAQATTPGKRYYLGKSRIPAPLVLIRHHGVSSLSVLAREILGLSKMDWNTFDLYAKKPATIQSSGEIARIGALLERFGPSSYDYRLFI